MQVKSAVTASPSSYTAPGAGLATVTAGSMASGAAHPGAARDWLRFITTDAAFAAFQRYGFKRYEGMAAPRGTGEDAQ